MFVRALTGVRSDFQCFFSICRRCLSYILQHGVEPCGRTDAKKSVGPKMAVFRPFPRGKKVSEKKNKHRIFTTLSNVPALCRTLTPDCSTIVIAQRSECLVVKLEEALPHMSPSYSSLMLLSAATFVGVRADGRPVLFAARKVDLLASVHLGFDVFRQFRRMLRTNTVAFANWPQRAPRHPSLARWNSERNLYRKRIETTQW